jgi:hypothetical protein
MSQSTLQLRARAARGDVKAIVATRAEVEEHIELLAQRQMVDAEPWQPPPFELEIYGLPILRPDGAPYVLRWVAGGELKIADDSDSSSPDSSSSSSSRAQ